MLKTETAHEPDEFIEPCAMTLQNALAAIASGQVPDAKTQVAILRYAVQQGLSA